MKHTPTREELLGLAREVDEARGIPTLSTADYLRRCLDRRMEVGPEELARRGAPDEGTFRRRWLADLLRLRKDWSRAPDGAGQRMEEMLRVVAEDAEMRGRL